MITNWVTRILIFPALIMTFGFGCYAGYSFQPQVKGAIDTYQLVKGVVLK